jgi:hypothetical protein
MPTVPSLKMLSVICTVCTCRAQKLSNVNLWYCRTAWQYFYIRCRGSSRNSASIWSLSDRSSSAVSGTSRSLQYMVYSKYESAQLWSSYYWMSLKTSLPHVLSPKALKEVKWHLEICHKNLGDWVLVPHEAGCLVLCRKKTCVWVL